MYGKLLPVTIDYRTQQRRVLTFALGTTGKLPDAVAQVAAALPDPDYRPNGVSQTRGEALCGMACLTCHGFHAVGGGTAPDLRHSSVRLDREAFRSVLKDGALEPNDMPRFDEFTDQQRDDFYQYILAMAREK